MDKYTKLEKAKALVSFEESDSRYGTQLFIALRSIKIELKEAMKIIISLNLPVDFKKYFESCVCMENNDIIDLDPRAHEFVEMGKEVIEDIAKTIKLPSTNILNMIWIEGIRFYKEEGATNTRKLMLNIKKIRNELFNIAGG